MPYNLCSVTNAYFIFACQKVYMETPDIMQQKKQNITKDCSEVENDPPNVDTTMLVHNYAVICTSSYINMHVHKVGDINTLIQDSFAGIIQNFQNPADVFRLNVKQITQLPQSQMK